MPARIEVQKAAVASWRRFGFDVASLNASDEIDHLHAEFEGVTFHRAGRDAKESLGRPLVYLDDMLAILARHTGRIGGVINADIVFSDDAGDVLAEALSLAEDAVLFGHRVDVGRVGMPIDPGAQIFLFGYDWFLFRTDQAPRMAGGQMVFGAPWWDIWLPLSARSLGLDIVNVRRPVALHENHVHRWNQQDLVTMGRVLTDFLVANARRMPAATRFQRRLSALATALEHMDPEAFADRDKLDWFASILRGLVQWETAPFGSDRHTRIEPFWDSAGQI
jgi:hypothetical protein